MKKTFQAIGIGIVVFIGVTSGLLYHSESIPNNAKIFVYPSERRWAPDSWFMKRDFQQALAEQSRAEHAKKLLAEQTPAQYSDVKNGGRYAGFEPFPVLLEEPGNILRGWNGSELKWWVLGKPRWNSDGSWNY